MNQLTLISASFTLPPWFNTLGFQQNGRNGTDIFKYIIQHEHLFMFQYNFNRLCLDQMISSKSCHDVNFVVTDDNVSCHDGNPLAPVMTSLASWSLSVSIIVIKTATGFKWQYWFRQRYGVYFVPNQCPKHCLPSALQHRTICWVVMLKFTSPYRAWISRYWHLALIVTTDSRSCYLRAV